MSKNINPLDHVSNTLHFPEELITKRACVGPHPKKLKVDLDEEVPTHKMSSLRTSQNLQGKGPPREEPTTASEGKTPPGTPREA